jgi:hypothetical protein
VDKIVAPLNESQQEDPEEEFKITAIMAKCGGLHAMKHFLHKTNDFGGADRELATLVLRLLFYSCKVCKREGSAMCAYFREFRSASFSIFPLHSPLVEGE